MSQERRRGSLDFSCIESQKDYKIPNYLGEVALPSLVPSHLLTHLCTVWIILLKDC